MRTRERRKNPLTKTTVCRDVLTGRTIKRRDPVNMPCPCHEKLSGRGRTYLPFALGPSARSCAPRFDREPRRLQGVGQESYQIRKGPPPGGQGTIHITRRGETTCLKDDNTWTRSLLQLEGTKQLDSPLPLLPAAFHKDVYTSTRRAHVNPQRTRVAA